MLATTQNFKIARGGILNHTRNGVRSTTDHEGGNTFQLGGGGELVSFQFAHFGIEAVNATLEDGEFLLELGHQLLELVGHFGDAVEASVEQSSCFEAGHGPATLVGAVGVTSDAAVALDQVGQSLVSPVGGLDVRELGDAGDLLLGGVLVDAVQVELSCGSGHGGQQTEGCRCNQELLKEFHGFLTRDGAMRRTHNHSVSQQQHLGLCHCAQ